MFEPRKVESVTEHAKRGSPFQQFEYSIRTIKHKAIVKMIYYMG